MSVQEAALACARVLGAAGALGPLPAPGAAHCAGRWRAQGPRPETQGHSGLLPLQLRLTQHLRD